MKFLTILGSTGSIGVSALKVVDAHPDRFRVTGLSAYSNAELLAEQARQYQPDVVCLVNESKLPELRDALAAENIEILGGRIGLLELAARDDATLVLNAIVGSPGMEPTIRAIEAGTDVALSNKESLVMAGDLIRRKLAEHDVALYPVDSEHSAIWQCLRGEQLSEVNKIILTASGGPFLNTPARDFKTLTVSQALDHPNWNMGKKITIDSATMMNKGLEVIEAHWLFDIPPDRIEVLVHPQSIIHSMVEFADGSVKAQLGIPDMKVPIQYALLYPEHAPPRWDTLDLASLGQLTFEAADTEKFRSIELAYKALQEGGTLPAVLNVANEVAVYAFLDEKIGFTDIPELVEQALEAHDTTLHPSLEVILETEQWTKAFIEPKLEIP
ncbi:MAG: 1-deoxy-D-xylulose-5-phosphate reductoisomerase [Candidatus Marinimicrobia bacterium]|nr:1-deoxy-D-xylulose-5-phosphate reductoisomerase [Candidatus Neomarinimicrobiota bacterium]MCF7829233.1 1-deoxy-D-xylulose-5-phosphate reductoisomerase [Candidatus Neomarinimicrobiota bacterium]MCF7881114.1 1-deoxy-D-xylulose-5-phosphate reductoisomerase [Candidatus Neomarinimicrobiota bacterium]